MLKRKTMWFIFCVAFCVAVPLRLIQQLVLLNAEGFYADGDVISWVLLFVLLGFTAISIAVGKTAPDLPKRYTVPKSVVAGGLQCLLGAMTVVYAISEIMRLANPADNGGLTGGLLYVAIILAFFGVGAGVVWGMIGVGSFVGKNVLRLLPTAGILPPIWTAILVFTNVVQFTGNTVTLNNLENTYDTLLLMVLSLFVFNHSKMIAGAQGKKCGKNVYAYGLPMVLFGTVTALPVFLSLITGAPNVSSFGVLFSIVISLLCIVAVVFLLLLPKGEQAFVEELVEAEAEEEVPVKKPKEKKEGSWLKRAILAILHGLSAMQLRIQNLFRRKRPTVEWQKGELDEKPTMRVDETWRLDFYGFEPKDDSKPYQPKVYKISEAEQKAHAEKQARVNTAVEEALKPQDKNLRISTGKRYKSKGAELSKKYRVGKK